MKCVCLHGGAAWGFAAVAEAICDLCGARRSSFKPACIAPVPQERLGCGAGAPSNEGQGVPAGCEGLQLATMSLAHLGFRGTDISSEFASFCVWYTWKVLARLCLLSPLTSRSLNALPLQLISRRQRTHQHRVLRPLISLHWAIILVGAHLAELVVAVGDLCSAGHGAEWRYSNERHIHTVLV